MTPSGMVAESLYNIFGEGTPPPSALAAANEMIVKCMRELDLEAPWYWQMGVKYFSVFRNMQMFNQADVPGLASREVSIKPGHVYQFSSMVADVNGDVDLRLLMNGPIGMKQFNETYKNIRNVFLSECAMLVKNQILTDALTPPTRANVYSGVTGEKPLSELFRMNRDVGEALLSLSPVVLSNYTTKTETDLAGTVDASDTPGSGSVSVSPENVGVPKGWFFGSDPVFQSRRDEADAVASGFNQEAFCMLVYPRPDKNYYLVVPGELYTTIANDQIIFGNGDPSTVSPMYEKALVELLTKSMATKFGYPQIAQIYERDYAITMDKLRSDNDRKGSYGLTLEYNDL